MRYNSRVMAGLDPAIHTFMRSTMDDDWYDKIISEEMFIASEEMQGLRRFLTKRSNVPDTEKTWSYFAHGYSSAFVSLARDAILSWPRRLYLQEPVFFLCRHSIELGIKAAIEGISPGTQDLRGHDIKKLWRELHLVMENLGMPAEDGWTKRCHLQIDHINEYDPNGEHFRYPYNTEGKPFDYTEVELVGLIRAHASVSIYCEAVVSMHQESLP